MKMTREHMMPTLTFVIALIALVLGAVAVQRQNSSKIGKTFIQSSSGSGAVVNGLSATSNSSAEATSHHLYTFDAPTKANFDKYIRDVIFGDDDMSVKDSLGNGNVLTIHGTIPGVSGNSIAAKFRYSTSTGVPSLQYMGSTGDFMRLNTTPYPKHLFVTDFA